jgi:hypothetical protein
MTEAEWLACEEPGAMLAWLLQLPGRRPSDRRLRLFACAIARRSPYSIVVQSFESIEREDGLKGGTGLSNNPPELARQWAATRTEWAAPLASRAALVRDLVGNPFRPVAAEPGWFTPAIVSLASAAYEERHQPSGELFHDRLLVLSDALEEAGCTDEDILAHLRSPGPHVRGCWAVDLVLGKE